ncbi:hypothetical protein [Paracoccus litorisediminis]|uniref:DUF3168 domain-containing protein n=1 Tax=Paracoccus litorisediminis TaxID=2006130 RepID=A0A844HUE9_9RHOB|nr:hypothetical protein [Paracoccus litorisediminis]MTH61201.1 hypothetical protein [Paracoccus litorisediminis]
MILEILSDKLIEAGFVPGKSLFLGHMNADAAGVLLRVPHPIPIDPEIPGRYRGEIQVLTRAKTVADGMALAARVQRLLTVNVRERLPGAHLDRCQPQALPLRNPFTESGQIEHGQYFDVIWGQAA